MLKKNLIFYLKRHGVNVSREKVVEAVNKPESLDRQSRRPLVIAQSTFDKEHVLRVIYKQEGETKIIITFYPGRIKEYGK